MEPSSRSRNVAPMPLERVVRPLGYRPRRFAGEDPEGCCAGGAALSLSMTYVSVNLSFDCVRIGFGPVVVGTGNIFGLGRFGALIFVLHSGW